MEIKTIAILGNNFISKVIALSLKINHPQITVKIFSNGEDYKQQIISTQYIAPQVTYSLPQFFIKHCNITISDIFERTNSTVGKAVIFEGIDDKEIIMPIREQNLRYRYLEHQCSKSNVFKNLSPHQKYLAFIEYLIQTNSNFMEIFTKFPFTLYQNQKNLYNHIIRLNPIREDVIWQALPSCCDLELLNVLLDEKLAGQDIQQISNPIINIDSVETTITEDKNLKTITVLHTNENSFPIDFVVNTGIDNSFFNSFIDSSDTLTETNNTIVFSGYSKQDFNFIEPAILRNKIQDNQLIKTLNYQDKSTEITFNNEFNNINKEQKKYLINDLYNSNYIEFNIEQLGLNPMFNEDITTGIVFINSIVSTLGSIIIDFNNKYEYLNVLQHHWMQWRSSLKKFAYYLFEDNSILGYESLKKAPDVFTTNFQNKVPSFILDEYHDIAYGYYDNSDKEAYSLFDYIIVAAQLGRITSFDYPLTDEDIFEKLAIFYEFEKNENIFSAYECSFEDFKNLVILDTPNFNPDISITEHNGITYETYIENVTVTRVRMIHDI